MRGLADLLGDAKDIWRDDLQSEECCGLASLVCQTDIRSEKDRELRGYFIPMTLDRFREKIPDMDPELIWYGPKMSCLCVYFNKETMAAALFPVLAYRDEEPGPVSAQKIQKFSQDVVEAEKAAAEGNILRGGSVFTGQMRMDYISEWVRKGLWSSDQLNNLAYLLRDIGRTVDSLPDDVLLQLMKSLHDGGSDDPLFRGLESLPEKITVYRGVNSKPAFQKDECGWTTDLNTAVFFACRGSGVGYVSQGTVRRKDVLGYRAGSPGNNLILLPHAASGVHVIQTLHSTAYLRSSFWQIMDEYLDALDMMGGIRYHMPDQTPHGKEHSRRVALLCLLLAKDAGLCREDREVLCTAAAYHDCERDNDGMDTAHGSHSADTYECSVLEPDPLVSAICEFHCRDDAEFERVVEERAELRNQKERALKLFRYFKDADALDLVRFRFQTLDYTMLRTKEAKALPLVAAALAGTFLPKN